MTSTYDTQCCEACPEAPRGASAPRSPGGLRLRKRTAFSVSTENDTLPPDCSLGHGQRRKSFTSRAEGLAPADGLRQSSERGLSSCRLLAMMPEMRNSRTFPSNLDRLQAGKGAGLGCSVTRSPMYAFVEPVTIYTRRSPSLHVWG